MFHPNILNSHQNKKTPWRIVQYFNCIKSVSTAKNRHVIVFGVSIDSSKNIQVKKGNMIRPAEEAMNLAVQAEPVSATTYFQPYQKRTEVGTPRTIAENRALSLHQLDIL